MTDVSPALHLSVSFPVFHTLCPWPSGHAAFPEPLCPSPFTLQPPFSIPALIRTAKNTHAQKPFGKESFLSVPFGSQGSPGKACANRGRGRAWVEPGFEDSLRGVLADIVKLLTSVSRQMFYISPRISLDNRTTGGRPLI